MAVLIRRMLRPLSHLDMIGSNKSEEFQMPGCCNGVDVLLILFFFFWKFFFFSFLFSPISLQLKKKT